MLEDDAPEKPTKVPASQWEQTDPAVVARKVPAAHGVHMTAPKEENLPMAHSRQGLAPDDALK